MTRAIGTLCILSVWAALALAGPAEPATAPAAGGPWLDMTYPFNQQSIYWPTADPFRHTPVFAGMTEKGYWYSSANFSASEHGGTHADAPVHFAQNGRTMGQIPIEEWIGPAVRLDVRVQCAKDRDYLLTMADVQAWEERHGRIPAASWVIMYTGVGTRHYPDRLKVLGTDKSGKDAVAELHFPGFSPEVAEWLIRKRGIRGIAIDTPSIDRGQSKDFAVHRVVCGLDRLILENIARCDRLPDSGATLYVIPMMIDKGTGAPARVFARLPAVAKPPGRADESGGETSGVK